MTNVTFAAEDRHEGRLASSNRLLKEDDVEVVSSLPSHGHEPPSFSESLLPVEGEARLVQRGDVRDQVVDPASPGHFGQPRQELRPEPFPRLVRT